MSIHVICAPVFRRGARGVGFITAAVALVALCFFLATPTTFAAGRPVAFSEVTGVFTNEFRVELRARTEGAVVRFTLDGLEPGPESASYLRPIHVTNTMQIRARSFGQDGVASEIVTHTYFLLARDLWDFSSNLPLAIVATFGTDIELNEKHPCAIGFVGNPDDRSQARTTWGSPLDATGRLLINQRGRASTRYPKRSFALKMLDEQDDFRSVSILGMPKDPDWILYAPYPDKTLMRDVLAYELSNQLDRWAPRTRFVELFVLEHPGRVSREDYVGVYVVMERVKRDGSRVDVTNLEADDNALPDVSGGYVFKKDHSSRNMPTTVVQGYAPFEAVNTSRTGYPTGPGAFPASPDGFQPPYRRPASSSTSGSSTSRPSSSKPKSSMITNIIGAPMPIRKEIAATSTRSVMIDEDGNETISISDEDEISIDTSFKTSVLTNRFYYVDPEPDEITGVQRAWLLNYLEDTERAVASPNFKDPARGYAAFIDTDSFIDYHLLVEVTKNVDGFRFSTFYHKDRGGKIKMGPLWDWNLSFGNNFGKQGYLSEYWLWPQLDDREYTWFRRLFEDPDFGQKYVDRWTELRSTTLATSNVLGRIDAIAALLDEAQKRNFERWPIMGVTVNPNWFVADTYAGEVAWMKEWLAKRLAWMEAQFVRRPTERRGDDGKVQFDAGEAEVYYTLDGTDPRAPGGRVAGSAVKYSEPLLVGAGQSVVARAKSGPRWSSPARLMETALATRQ